VLWVLGITRHPSLRSYCFGVTLGCPSDLFRQASLWFIRSLFPLSTVQRYVADPLSDIDVLSYYLSGLTPKKVHSFGSIGHFKPSKKPAEAGDAKRCFDCAYESKCVWSAKKIYVEPLKGTEDTERVCRADLLRQASIAERRASTISQSLVS
jgi:hypothetical protein